MFFCASTIHNLTGLARCRSVIAFALCCALFTSNIAGAVMVVTPELAGEESGSLHHGDASVHTTDNSAHDLHNHHKDNTSCEHGECDCSSSHIACTVHCSVGVPSLELVDISPLYMSIGALAEANLAFLNRNISALFKPPRI